MVAALSCLAAGHASASVPLVTDPSGGRIAVGDVVGVGTVDGDFCAFAVPAVVIVHGGGTVALSTTDDCRVVVSAITTAGPGAARTGTFVLPAVPDPTGTHGLGGTGDAATSAGHPVSPRVGKVWQDAYDVRGAWQAGSYFSVNFSRDQVNGALIAPQAGYGQCTANAYPAGVGLTDVVATTSPTSCSWSVPESSADSFELRGYGVFSHKVLGIEDSRFSLDASLYAYRDIDPDFASSCAVGIINGTWPRGWGTSCTAVEEEGVQ